MKPTEVEILAKVYDIKKKYKPNHYVRVIIGDYPHPFDWEEEDVRAFQILVHNSTEEEYQKLKETVTIYSGPKITGSHKMIIRKDGKFENEFEPGFFDGNANMAFGIL